MLKKLCCSKQDSKMTEQAPEELKSPSWWINHNRDICKIKNYCAKRNHLELMMFRQKTEIARTCEYCLTCDKCKKYLTYSKELKNKGFWSNNEKVGFGRFSIQTGHIKTTYLKWNRVVIFIKIYYCTTRNVSVSFMT